MPAADQPSAEFTGPPLAPAVPAGVAEEALSRFLHCPYHALRHVACEFRDGVLTLGGCVPSYYLKQVAQTLVVHLDGVKQVVNHIAVRPPGRRGRRA